MYLLTDEQLQQQAARQSEFISRDALRSVSNCRRCRRQFELSNADLCQPCAKLVIAERIDREFRLETMRELKIYGFAAAVGGLMIALTLWIVRYFLRRKGKLQ